MSTLKYVDGLSASFDDHSGYESHGGHSGYGSSGYGGGGGHSGHSGYGVKGSIPCCPLVVDPLTLGAILGFLGLATALLIPLISASLGRRKKRSDGSFVGGETGVIMQLFDVVHHGRFFKCSFWSDLRN